MKTPAAKFDSSPPHAAPIAMPSAAISAANDVVSTPKYPRMPMTSSTFSATLIVLPM